MSENLKNLNHLKKSLEFMGEEELRRTLTYLIKVYVLDKNSNQSSSNSRLPADKNSSFFDLITGLKGEYNTPELDMFQLESGKVYFEMDNRRLEVAKSDSLMPAPAPVMSPPSIEMNEPTPTPGTPEPPRESSEDDTQPQRFRSLEF